MYRDLHIVVAIPAHNAASTVLTVIDTLPPFVDGIVAVDDASKDNTWEVLKSSRDPRLTVVHHEVNQGVGGAMRTAFKQALGLACDVVVKMDSDGQMHPEDLPTLLDALIDGHYDYAKGNRFLDHRGELERMPKMRLVGSLALTALTKLASGYWHIFDPQNGYVACRATVLRRLDLDRIARDYFFENDMLINLNIIGARVVDVPMPARYAGERSSMSIPKVLFRFPSRLFLGYWRRILERFIMRDFSPLVLFLLSGIVLLTFGTAFGGYAWFESYRTGVVASSGTIMLAALPFILGFQLVLQAIMLDIQSTPR
jgi:glycosyltransferase involved in cell wall biosynthesis